MLKTKHFKFTTVIGLGYWYDEYQHPFMGYTHNFVLPFMYIQIGELGVVNKA